MKPVHIGTSGWQFDSWKGSFYPERISSSEMLSAFAESFHCVETNGTFYRLPNMKTVQEWVAAVPSCFRFTVKASRYITHMKKLKEPVQPLGNLYRVLDALGDKCGPVLFQLPPSWRVNANRLRSFLECLSGEYQYAFEFRDRSWFCDEVIDLLHQHGMALCQYDLKQWKSPDHKTADFRYVRLHGPETEAYKGSYHGNSLRSWVRQLHSWREDSEVWVFFDNDEKACAPRDARRLTELLEK